MRRPLRQYVQALYAAVKAEDANLQDVGRGFIALLARDGILAKADAILELFRKEWNRREGNVDVSIATAREISKTEQQRIADAVASMIKKERATVYASVDPSLIGGVRLQYDDVILDGSVRRNLQQLHRRMI